MSQYFEESMLIEQPDETPEQLLARYEQQARAWRHRQGIETDERAATFAGDVAHMIEQLTETLSTALSQTHEGRQVPNSGVGGILVRELDEWAEKTANLRSLLNRSADHIEFIETDAEARAGDEHHTMDELYEYRMLYNALAANEWARHGTYPVVKSWRHSDGEECFGGGWFIVVATLPTGQVSNHYSAEHWDLFTVPAVETPPEYDGHDPAEAARRMLALIRNGADR